MRASAAASAGGETARGGRSDKAPLVLTEGAGRKCYQQFGCRAERPGARAEDRDSVSLWRHCETRWKTSWELARVSARYRWFQSLLNAILSELRLQLDSVTDKRAAREVPAARWSRDFRGKCAETFRVERRRKRARTTRTKYRPGFALVLLGGSQAQVGSRFCLPAHYRNQPSRAEGSA